MITIALSKGRLFMDFINFLNDLYLKNYSSALEDGGRNLYTNVDNVRFIFAKGRDVSLYVERGVADLGIVGEDLLEEDPKDVLKLAKLPFGVCRMCVCGPSGLTEIKTVASSFPKISQKYFREKKQDVEVLLLNGSVELAPILGLSDAIVDIVQTGTTLRENGLVEYETIMDIQARLIANKKSFYTKEEEVYSFIKEMGIIN